MPPDPGPPFGLRTVIHTLTTEAIAMLFGKIGKGLRWLKRFLQVDEAVVDVLAPELAKQAGRAP